MTDILRDDELRRLISLSDEAYDDLTEEDLFIFENLYGEEVIEKSIYVQSLKNLYLNHRERFNNLKAYIKSEQNYNIFLRDNDQNNELKKFNSMMNTMKTAVAASRYAVAQRRKRTLKRKIQKTNRKSKKQKTNKKSKKQTNKRHNKRRNK